MRALLAVGGQCKYPLPVPDTAARFSQYCILIASRLHCSTWQEGDTDTKHELEIILVRTQTKPGILDGEFFIKSLVQIPLADGLQLRGEVTEAAMRDGRRGHCMRMCSCSGHASMSTQNPVLGGSGALHKAMTNLPKSKQGSMSNFNTVRSVMVGSATPG